MANYLITIKGKKDKAHCSGCATMGEAIANTVKVWGIKMDDILHIEDVADSPANTNYNEESRI